MKKIIVFCTVFVLGGMALFAQLPEAGYGPGGIGVFSSEDSAAPYMALWLRADAGVEMSTLNTEKVKKWTNQTGDFNHATDEYAGQKYNVTFNIREAPKYSTNAVGGMPAINFGDPEGDRYALTIDNALNPNVPRLDDASNFAVFMVFSRKDIIENAEGTDFRAIIQKRLESDDPPTGRAWGLEFDGGAEGNLNKMQWAVNRDFDRKDVMTNTVFGADRIGQPQVFGAIKGSFLVSALSADTTDMIFMYVNGRRDNFDYYGTDIVKTIAPTVIGQAEYTDIAEIIIYRGFINHVHSVILSNHLGAKYNAEIRGMSQFNDPVYKRLGACRFDVIGVGQGPYDEWSHSVSAGGGVMLEATQMGGLNRYAFVGHHDSTGIAPELDSNGVLSRYYYLQNEGVEALNLYFDFAGAGLADPDSVGDYKLYFSAENESNWVEADFDSVRYEAGAIRFSSTDMSSGFYTIGKTTPDLEVEVGIYSVMKDDDIPFTIYPNPVKDVLTISFDQYQDEPALVNLYNYAGVIVRSEQAIQASVQLDVADLPEGFYVVEVLLDNGRSRGTKKIIKH